MVQELGRAPRIPNIPKIHGDLCSVCSWGLLCSCQSQGAGTIPELHVQTKWGQPLLARVSPLSCSSWSSPGPPGAPGLSLCLCAGDQADCCQEDKCCLQAEIRRMKSALCEGSAEVWGCSWKIRIRFAKSIEADPEGGILGREVDVDPLFGGYFPIFIPFPPWWSSISGASLNSGLFC